MDKITFTLKEMRKHQPCKSGWKTLYKTLGGIKKCGENTPITVEQLIASNGYEDTLWCLRTTPEDTHNLWRHFAVDCAQMVEHLMEDERSKDAIVVARKFANGNATEEELAAAWDAAWAAVQDASRDAAWAAWAASRDAAWDAAWAASRAAARAAARDAAWDAQQRLLKKYCRLGTRPENSAELLKRYYKEEREK